jgi:hypothetical protein
MWSMSLAHDRVRLTPIAMSRGDNRLGVLADRYRVGQAPGFANGEPDAAFGLHLKR